ncbi:serine--tRNA ligase [Wenxinia saemankumensis]|uniref:Serine--tRNA ligase n=1 Tax=Wenxinia saemankumensis TaxID=1447782 RepID=A0A1M6EWS2_9RHOB|nr:serine--tRNA ligase [Wenxinia saemankumensis]SHI89856.1 seryl-tRNA synthetase [Wenxinia saemankumensis]
MHDIKDIREAPDAFDRALSARGLAPMSSSLLALDAERRALIHEAETLQAEQNRAAKEIGRAKASGDEAEFERLRAEVSQKKAEGQRLTEAAKARDEDLRDALLGLPNLPMDDVPEGADEADNVEQARWGAPRNFSFAPREHYQIPAVKDGLDFEAAARLSGSRFVVLRGAAARLHRALGQFMIDHHVETNGLSETWTPILVRDEMMVGTGQLPKFADDSFFGASMTGRGKIARSVLENYVTFEDVRSVKDVASFAATVEKAFSAAPTHEEFWLIPTAEVTLTNMVHGQTVEAAALPMRMVALTQCFRSEAGSAGRDTAGMLRQHQFEKCEMVTICTPETSEAEHLRMTEAAESVLQALNLPYRRMLLCAGDMGAGARRTYDLEVWLPGQDTYREISSISTCGAFQARRMNARYRPEGGGRPDFVHTLNGSGLAVGRTLIAVLENGQEEDGSVTLPEVLAPYLRGRTRILADGTFA